MWRRLKEKAEAEQQQKQEEVEEQLAVKMVEEVGQEYTVADLVGCSQIPRWP